jgi:hypothetical protein
VESLSAYRTLPQRLEVALGVAIGGGDEVSSSSEMCSWKRGDRDLLRGTGVLSSMGITSRDE